jgi:NADH-quinone oxidoreductase subunit L
MVWLYSRTGTLMFYDVGGSGCLEQGALAKLVAQTTVGGMLLSTAIGLLIFCGAVGKSGQVPLHVWLPDAMEGPTPVSALIHAATMVAAGVFLVARMYPLMSAHPVGFASDTPALHVITWVGVITAVFAATIAVAQTDIKRILAYSTVSQLGFMMMGLGAGGVAVGMFHLITHAFFKALLFMGAGSVIHGCHDEQDIRRMGGLRRIMPITFATYAIGMMALSGVPIFFSGFWSKDEILHAAHGWMGSPSHLPFYLGVFGAFLTAFYMTRQMFFVFAGECRLGFGKTTVSEIVTLEHGGEPAEKHPGNELDAKPHESPPVMTIPLIILAFFSIVLGFFGTPAWPWFQSFIGGADLTFKFANLTESGVLSVMVVSTIVVVLGIGLGWWLYGRRGADRAGEDVLQRAQPEVFELLRRKYYVDEAYEWAVVGFNAWFARACRWVDSVVCSGGVLLASWLVIGLSWLSRLCDEKVVNPGFDRGCEGLTGGGRLLSRLQNGRIQNYLRVIGIALTFLALFVIWGCRSV